jgi:hypothetical protein
MKQSYLIVPMHLQAHIVDGIVSGEGRSNRTTAVDFAADSGLRTTGDIRADLGLELPDHRPAAIWLFASAVERFRMATGRRTGGR